MLSETLFHLRDNEDGLSVFDSCIATPNDVLSHQLSIWTRQRVKFQKKINECGGTTEGMMRIGWGVATVHETSLVAMGFDTSRKPDANGHFEALGSKEEYQRQAPILRDEAVLVDAGTPASVVEGQA